MPQKERTKKKKKNGGRGNWFLTCVVVAGSRGEASLRGKGVGVKGEGGERREGIKGKEGGRRS